MEINVEKEDTIVEMEFRDQSATINAETDENRNIINIDQPISINNVTQQGESVIVVPKDHFILFSPPPPLTSKCSSVPDTQTFMCTETEPEKKDEGKGGGNRNKADVKTDEPSNKLCSSGGATVPSKRNCKCRSPVAPTPKLIPCGCKRKRGTTYGANTSCDDNSGLQQSDNDNNNEQSPLGSTRGEGGDPVSHTQQSTNDRSQGTEMQRRRRTETLERILMGSDSNSSLPHPIVFAEKMDSSTKKNRKPKKNSLPTVSTTSNDDRSFRTDESIVPLAINNFCPCGDSSNSSETWILCDGACSRWFHSSCAGLTDNEVKSLGADKSTKWFCFSCTVPQEVASQSSTKSDNLVTCPFSPENPKKYKGQRGLNLHIASKHPDASKPISENSSFLTSIADWKRNIRVLKRIPKAARISAANRLSFLINNCVENNNCKAWSDLFSFSYTALQAPDPKSKSRSLSAFVKQNINVPSVPSSINKKHTTTSLSRRVESKVSEGDIRGAIKLLASDDTIAPQNDFTLSKLIDKHPPPTREFAFVPPSDENPLVVSETDVKKAILSFPNGSASGIDGVRPQHLKDIVSSANGDAAARVLTSITRLCNFALAGKLDNSILPIFYGASLCALNKKCGGIRPIAVGNCFRRLVAKLACSAVNTTLSSYLNPYQLGFATKGGCEIIVHSVRSFLTRNNLSDKVLLLIDFANAFNTVNRDVMLSQVKSKCPGLYPFLFQAYSTFSNLYYGSEIIHSVNGCHQGDPCGPLLFCLAIQPILEQLESELNLSYLDDGTLGGNADTVLSDLAFLIEKCKDIGLHINSNKCQLFYTAKPDPAITEKFNSICPNIQTVSQIKLLGSPITLEVGNEIFASKLKDIKLLLSRLALLNNHHIAYYLLRNCFAIPKLTYLLRTSPNWLYEDHLKNWDLEIKCSLEKIINTSLPCDKYILASLPLNCGGLGIRRAVDVGLPAFLSSVNSVTPMVCAMLNLPISSPRSISFYEEGLARWNITHDLIPQLSASQKNWDIINTTYLHNQVDLSDDFDKARSLAVLCPESNAWLHALPSRSIGTLLDNNSFRICTALRLGCNICSTHKCRCGDLVSENGLHGLSCVKSSGRYSRHQEINDIICRSLNLVNFPSRLEPAGLFRNDLKRVDGMTLIPWCNGKSLVWDATCSDTIAPSHLFFTKLEPRSAAKKAAANKVSKYSNLIDQNYHFVPFAVETFGPFCEEALQLTKEIGRLLSHKSGDPRSTSFLTQRISLAIQRGNAASVMGTFPTSSKMDEIFYIL